MPAGACAASPRFPCTYFVCAVHRYRQLSLHLPPCVPAFLAVRARLPAVSVAIFKVLLFLVPVLLMHLLGMAGWCFVLLPRSVVKAIVAFAKYVGPLGRTFDCRRCMCGG